MNSSTLSMMLGTMLMLLTHVSMAQQDAIQSYFQKYLQQEEFTSIYISPRMFNLFANKDADSEAEIDEAISRLSGLRILTADTLPARNGVALYQEAMQLIEPQSYEELMSIRDGEEQVRFYVLNSTVPDKVKELLMIVGSPNSFFLLSITGNISLKQIASLSETLDVQGMDRLGDLDQN